MKFAAFGRELVARRLVDAPADALVDCHEAAFCAGTVRRRLSQKAVPHALAAALPAIFFGSERRHVSCSRKHDECSSRAASPFREARRRRRTRALRDSVCWHCSSQSYRAAAPIISTAPLKRAEERNSPFVSSIDPRRLSTLGSAVVRTLPSSSILPADRSVSGPKAQTIAPTLASPSYAASNRTPVAIAEAVSAGSYRPG